MTRWQREEEDPVRFEDVKCLKETPKALLCRIDGVDHWIPKSQITDDSEVWDEGEHAEGTLVITAWLANEKGLG